MPAKKQINQRQQVKQKNKSYHDGDIVTPLDFALVASKEKYLSPDHLILLNKYLYQVYRGDIKRLAIMMPPRHGKSSFTSMYFPAWYLSRKPDNRIILTSYEAEFAAGWGHKTRNLINEYNELLGVRVSKESSAKDRWDIAGHSGGMYTAGVGGAVTGKGADLLIIDDPVKNAEQAHSPTYRNKTYDWYESTAYTRLEPGGAVIVIQTRWNKEDLIGKILSKESHKWKVLSLPAFAVEGDELGRQPGEPLFIDRYDTAALLDIKETIGPYWFAALYQQNPVDDENAIFKKEYIKYCNYSGGVFELDNKLVSIEDCTIFQTCDPAASKKTTADFFVLCTWAMTPDADLILLDVFRLRLTGPDQIKLFRAQRDKWRPVAQFVEQAGVGYTMYQFLEAEGLPVRPLKPGNADKVTRALPAAARMAAGKIYIIAAAQRTWGPDFEDEILTFPLGAKDDQVDNLSYAVMVLAEVKKLRSAFNYGALSKKRQKKQ